MPKANKGCGTGLSKDVGTMRPEWHSTEGIADRLRIVRAALDFTEQQMAKACGVTLATYRKYEAGAPMLKWRHVVCNLRKYGLTADWLLCGDAGHQKKVGSKVVILPVLGRDPRERKERAELFASVEALKAEARSYGIIPRETP